MKTKFFSVIIWACITLFVVYAFCLNTAGSVFAETIKKFLQASDIGTAAAVGSFVVGFALMQIPAGYLLDTYSMRWVVSAGVFFLAFGNFLITFAHNLPFFCFCNLIQGIGASFAFIAVGKSIGEWFAPNMFPIMFGLTQSTSCVLAAIVHYYLVMALETVTWQDVYVKLSIFGFILLVLTFILVRQPRKNKSKGKALSLMKSFGIVFGNKQILLCAITAATSFGVLAAYASFWYFKVQKFYDVSTTDSLMISGMVFVGIGIGTPFLGWVSNKLKSRRLVIHYSLVLGVIFLMMGLYLPHYKIATYIPIELISFCIGFFLSGSMLLYTCTSETASPETTAVALGVINTSVFLANTIMLFVPQFFITDESTTFFTYLWVLPTVVMCSLLFSYFVKETYSSGKH